MSKYLETVEKKNSLWTGGNFWQNQAQGGAVICSDSLGMRRTIREQSEIGQKTHTGESQSLKWIIIVKMQ